jgi:hypothetical protein
MRIEILKQTSIAGSPARVGQVMEASDSDAAILVAMKKARPAHQDLASAVIEPAPEARPRPRKPRPLS